MQSKSVQNCFVIFFAITSFNKSNFTIMAKGDKLYYKALHLAKQDDCNYHDVLHLLNESIRLGNKKASYALATWYLNGFHVRKNYKKGFSLLQNAIQGGPENNFTLYKRAKINSCTSHVVVPLLQVSLAFFSVLFFRRTSCFFILLYNVVSILKYIWLLDSIYDKSSP